MKELKWKEAIVKVFEEERKALHYTKIAELIAERGYRRSLGATPQDTVSSNITTDINTNKEDSIFFRVDKGIYILRKFVDQEFELLSDEPTQKSEIERIRIINAFGIHWNRNLVYWKPIPDLLGVQQLGATEVNFKNQFGIYLLHDDRETIYVGRAIEQPLGVRLRHHTIDRMAGRWNRFSWFGFYGVSNTGELHTTIPFEQLTMPDVGNILEAILIESIEPRQNRRQGDLFSGIEYLQKESPEVQKKKKVELLKELTDKI